MPYKKRDNTPWYAKQGDKAGGRSGERPSDRPGDKKYPDTRKNPGEKDGDVYAKPYKAKRGEQGRKQKFDSWAKDKKSFSDRQSIPKTAPKPAQPPIQQPIAPPRQEAEYDGPLLIYGRNPVKEAIKSGKSIDKLYISEVGAGDGSLREILRTARERSLVIVESNRKKLDELTLPFGYGSKSANHQGVVAQMPECQYVEIADILAKAREKGQPPFVLVLDSIMDPQNLGSIIRSADCAGVHGVIIPKRRAASVTAVVARASAGAVLYASVARVPNLAAAIDELKAAGLWVAGADSSAQPMTQANLAGPLALVIGAEGEGLSRLIKDKCDFCVAVPLRGSVESLNASVAAGILMFEKIRQDGSSGQS